jgi:hypothetical protein
MERRSFLPSLAAATTAPGRAAVAADAGRGLVDTNVHLSSWVVRRSGLDTPRQLVEKLRRHDVTQAWTGSFEAVLHTDLAGANTRLADACAREGGGTLVPFGSVNPLFPDWEDDVRRCHEVHRMPGLRLYPSYHGYALDHPQFARLLALAAARRLFVQIALSLEDDRTHNPVLTVAPVNPAPLPDLLAKVPAARVMLLNASSRVLAAASPLLARLAKSGVYFEISCLEGVAGVGALLAKHPALRLCFGSHTPYFYFEAALLKLQESALSPAQLAAVGHGHAQAALA